MEKNTLPKCPSWAEKLLAELLQTEIALGHIPESLAWKSQSLGDVSKKAFRENAVADESKTEILYHRLVHALHKEGFEAENIAEIINSRISYEGGPPYTDLSEVEDALQRPL